MKYLSSFFVLLIFATPVFAKPTLAEEYLLLMNNFRQSQGLRPLTPNTYMSSAAIKHSKNMGRKLIPFGHLGSSKRCSYVQKAMGGGNLCGEIVAQGQATPAAVLKAWKNSLGHRKVMLESRYTHTGIGVVRGINGTLYWTQIFLER